MRRDLLEDCYGRFYELPKELSKLELRIDVICLSYYKNNVVKELIQNGLTWSSYNIGFNKVWGLIKHFYRLKKNINKNNPDKIFAASDAVHCILAWILSKCTKKPYIIDLYDNFESYGLIKFPFVRKLYKVSLLNAEIIFVVSKNLKQYIEDKYQPNAEIIVIENAVPSNNFLKLDKQDARKELKLPKHKILIGTAGALYNNRGIQLIYDAFNEILKNNDDIYLVLAGHIKKGEEPESNENIIYLGELDYNKMPILFSSLDVGIVYIDNNEFGKYCFPQKMIEMLSCNLPIVASNIGVMSDFFSKNKNCLYQYNNIDSFISAINYQLENHYLPSKNRLTWSDQAINIANVIKKNNY